MKVFKNNIQAVFLLIYLLGMSVYFYKHEYYNWDIEAYMALIHKAENPNLSAEELHGKVYGELRGKKPERFVFPKSNVEPETKGADEYYKILSENPKAFEEELQFFSVKPFYNFVNFLFYKIGFDASTSTFLISIISYFLIIFLGFLFLKKELKNNWLALILALIISLFKPLHDSTRHSTPDMFGTFLLLVSFYFVYRKNLFSATIFSMFTIFTRPEYFVFYTLIFLLSIFFNDLLKFRKKDLLISYVYLFLSFAMIQFFSKISWETLIMNQFIKVQIYPISNPDKFSFSDYLGYIKRHILLEFNSSYFPILLLFSIIIFGRRFDLNYLKNKCYLLVFSFIFVIYLNVFLRFFIFPTLVNRMMVGFYLLIVFTLILYQNSIIPKKNS